MVEVEKRAVEMLIRQMPKSILLILLAATSIEDGGKLTVEDVYQSWVESLRRRGLPVLSKRRFYDYITELKERGFIDVVRRGKGRGRGFEYQVVVQPQVKEVLREVLEHRNTR